ncbi:Mov34/MPN/PAD-1 family protein [Paenibacillus thermoaerophilus]|uniref:Mov34/MPN/PAD-1 family protein n=1 Tax=Paenibacillus thermoaerophilus TaxID=1215385 RepID=A0ABW2V7H0_9BACL|nr:Mov34/MPN/PAD-1 family protein [Paenibacillus thermoaerophilus]
MLNATIQAAILGHAVREFPSECCGVVTCCPACLETLRAGSPPADCGCGQYIPLRNASDDPARSYTPDPRDWTRLIGSLRPNGRGLAAIVHSHPSAPPLPSESDTLEWWPDIPCQIIVSLLDRNRPDLRVYCRNAKTPDPGGASAGSDVLKPH